jgi:hypothetical protein
MSKDNKEQNSAIQADQTEINSPGAKTAMAAEATSQPVNKRKRPHRQQDVETTRPPLPRLAFSMRECATMLNISYISVWRLVARGLLKPSTGLRHKRISLVEINRYLAATSK